MKTQVNPVPPPEHGQIRWLRPKRTVTHNQFDVQEYGEKGWTTIVYRLDRNEARQMCRNANVPYQRWFENRARIAREIEAKKRAEQTAKEDAEKREAKTHPIIRRLFEGR
jgi:hypothetical protein